MRATESGRLRYLLLGALLVGIGFNIKMLAAYLPLPAFYGVYLLGSAERLWRKLTNLVLASVLLIAVSLSWAVAVDLTPADQRPFVGSSGDNSVMSLIVEYNGLQRLLGRGGSRDGVLSFAVPDGGSRSQSGSNSPFSPPNSGSSGSLQQPDGGANRQSPPSSQGGDGGRPGAGPAGGFGGPGGGIGQPGLLRLVSTPLSKEVSWLLPFALFSAVLLVFRARPCWPLALKHQSFVFWGGWLVTGAAFFSIAGYFHEYYLSVMAPPLAVLVGIGAVELWRLRQRRRLAIIGYSCVLAALLLTPGVWSGLTVANASQNQSLPSAYGGRESGPVNRGGLQVDQALLDYLEPRTPDTTYLMAVPSSMQGADYVIATGRPVLYLGGFVGQDRVVTADDLARMVANGELRYVYGSGNSRGAGLGAQSDVSSWVASSCVAVRGFDTTMVNAGTPDGTTTGRGGSSSANGARTSASLYDCGGPNP